MNKMAYLFLTIGIISILIGLIFLLTGNNSRSEKADHYKDSKEQSQPELTSKQKGNMMEDFVANLFSNSSNITILEWNQGTTSSQGAYGLNELNPDFRIRQKVRDDFDLTYWVECKYRSSFPGDTLSFDQSQIERYRTIQRESRNKIFMAIGKGGAPDQPASFYFIPLDSIKNTDMAFDNLKKYYIADPENFMEGWIKDYFFNKVFNKNK